MSGIWLDKEKKRETAQASQDSEGNNQPNTSIEWKLKAPRTKDSHRSTMVIIHNNCILLNLTRLCLLLRALGVLQGFGDHVKAEEEVLTTYPSSKTTARPSVTSSPSTSSKPTHSISPSMSPSTSPSNKICGTNQTSIRVDFLTDDYPTETTWKVIDIKNNFTLVSFPASVGSLVSPETFYSSGTYCVDQINCYQFAIDDVYGDGLCCSYGVSKPS